MCAVLVGFCQSQIGEPIKLAAIPIHMNHVLKIRDFANGGINRDKWDRHRIIESGNLPHTNRAQPIGHSLGIGFRPARTNHFLVRIIPASDQPYSIRRESTMAVSTYGRSRRDVTVRADEAARFRTAIRDSGRS